jgi:hypothetical protein
MFGGSNTRMFAIKCLMRDYPLLFLSVSGGTIIFFLAYSVKIIEGPIFVVSQDQYQVFTPFANCVWYVIITMTTVGYGDYYPGTTLGKFIAVVIAFIGAIFTSLAIITLQQNLNLNDIEMRTVEFFERLGGKEYMKSEASTLFKYSFKYLLARNRYLKALKNPSATQEAKELQRKKLERTVYERIIFKKGFKKTIQ